MDFNSLLDVVESADRETATPLGAGRPFLEFDPEEYGRRLNRATRLIDAVGLDALVLGEPANVRYFTGLRSWFTALPPVLPIVAVIAPEADRSTIVDTATEQGSIEGASWIEKPALYGPLDDPVETLVRALDSRDLSHARLGLELGHGRLPHLSPGDLDRLRTSLPNATFIDASDVLHAARAIKSPAELAFIRQAVDLIVGAFAAVCHELRTGITEVEMTRIAALSIANGGGEPDMNPQVFIFMAGRERYRLPLLPATDRGVRANELISLDGGSSAHGYHSDFARAAVIGELPPGVRQAYEATVEALVAAESAMGPNRLLGDAWSAANAALGEYGFEAHAVNPINIGHSIGLDHWERPTVAQPETEMGRVRARPGMVLCVEPQIAGIGGDAAWAQGLFLVEDQLLITHEGIEVLTGAFPRDLYVSGG
jgi:Xaa-Pro aminopeptidase